MADVVSPRDDASRLLANLHHVDVDKLPVRGVQQTSIDISNANLHGPFHIVVFLFLYIFIHQTSNIEWNSTKKPMVFLRLHLIDVPLSHQLPLPELVGQPAGNPQKSTAGETMGTSC